jgi:hypothetical protein
MNKTLTIITGLMMMLTLSVGAQEPGKAGDYVKGELIVQVLENASIREIVSRAPDNYYLQVEKILSPTSHIWQLTFDYTVITHEGILNWVYAQEEVELAQNNYYLELRSTIPNESTSGSFSMGYHNRRNYCLRT